MSNVLEALLQGEYRRGLEWYHTLEIPTPDEHRWASSCYFNLGFPLDARDLLLRARANGCEAANIELVTVHRQLGEVDESRSLLAELDPSKLHAFDRTLYWREVFGVCYANDDLQQGRDAWTSSFGDDRATSLQAGIAQCLGMVYAALGQDRRAERYFDEALKRATAARAAYVHLGRAACHTRMGRHEEAQADLHAAVQFAPLVPAISAVLSYHQGAAAWTKGDLHEARRCWTSSVALAHDRHDLETECYAQLGLAALDTPKDIAATRRALSRANATSVTRVTQALVSLRRGALAHHDGEACARTLLETASMNFSRLNRLREAAWADLHLAEHLLSRGDVTAEDVLSRVTDRRHALGSGAAFVPELRALPLVRAHLTRLPQNHYLRTLLADMQMCHLVVPLEVRLVTLGDARLLVDGKPARLEMVRSLEVFAYLLRRPRRTISEMAADLFPDEDPKKAKNYLHQARYDLERAAPGLRIPPDTCRRYSVQCDGPTLSWDVLEVVQALHERSTFSVRRALEAYSGPFLAASDSVWATEEREEVAWSVVRVALELIEECFVRAEYEQCLYLAGRLLEIDPYDDAPSEYLVKAVRALNGNVAARHTVSRLISRHQHDMGSVPTNLLKLQAELLNLN